MSNGWEDVYSTDVEQIGSLGTLSKEIMELTPWLKDGNGYEWLSSIKGMVFLTTSGMSPLNSMDEDNMMAIIWHEV